MKEAQTRDVRVSSKGQGGWEKKERAVDARCRKAFSWGLCHSESLCHSETSFLPLSILRNQVLVTTKTSSSVRISKISSTNGSTSNLRYWNCSWVNDKMRNLLSTRTVFKHNTLLLCLKQKALAAPISDTRRLANVNHHRVGHNNGVFQRQENWPGPFGHNFFLFCFW